MTSFSRALMVGLICSALQHPAFAAKQAKSQKKGAVVETGKDSLAEKMARLKPVTLNADVSRLTPGDRQALDKIIAAARLLDPIYLRQVWSGNVALEKKLQGDELKYFRMNGGPWSRLDDNASFIAGVPAHKPPQAGFYPDDMTKPEFEAWVKTLGDADRAKATGFFWTVRRDAAKKLTLVPYSQEYKEFVEPAAKLLKEAAALTTNDSLKKYLTKRAESFLSDDYYDSDVAWMDLDAPLEITIGPYETYEDELFNYKACFEAFVTLRDEAESTKLAKFSAHLQDIENHLPLDDKHKNPKLGALSPIRVVDEVYTSGEAKRGVQTAAYNLPNDERVVKEKGSKRVMLKNVQEAKFASVLMPIAKVLIDPTQLKDVAFEPFFTHILMHELMHGLGPHNIKVGGRDTTARMELKELHSAIEEAKADITGLFAMQYLIDKGVIEKSMETPMYTTYLASAFRSVRFGITEAHGKGVAMQFNYLMDRGAIELSPKGSFHVVPAKIKDAVTALTRELLTVEAEGSYVGAKKMLDTLGVIRPVMAQALKRLEHVPVDIWPTFPLAQ